MSDAARLSGIRDCNVQVTRFAPPGFDTFVAAGGDALDRAVVDDAEGMVSRGSALPAELYVEPWVAALEEACVWRRSWFPIGLVQELDRGAVLTGTAGFTPICAVRTGAGGIAATVGAAPLVAQAPLVTAAADTLGGVVYVSVAPAEPLADFLGEAPAIAREMGWTTPFELHDDWVRVTGRQRPVEVRANWKVAVENALECYHCPTVHADSFAADYDVSPEGYRVGTFDRGAYHLARYSERRAARLGLAPRATPRLGAADLQHLFPFPTGVGIGHGPAEAREHWLGLGVQPRGAGACVVMDGITFRRDGADQPRTDEAVGGELPTFEASVAEDAEICAGVQDGLASGAVRTGPVGTAGEVGVRHFQRYWLDAVRRAVCDG